MRKNMHIFSYFFQTCSGKTVALFVCWPVDELPQAGHSGGANQGETSKSPAVYHSNVQWRVEQLVLWQILQNYIVITSTLIV